jgi:FAD/FMN-containing dehydrogenase
MLSTPHLAGAIKGRVITPDDADYDTAREVFLGDIDRRPELIVRVADDADVARVVAIARETGLDLAVRSGGHSAAGHGVSERGIVLDLGDMRALDIDVVGRTAWAETGLTAGEYTTAVGEHGLATGFGDSGSVGLGGITTAGGIGFLVRKHGMTIDNVLAADVVTASGELVRTDAETNPDLFWAIRGGGGNFGVVTRVKYRLHEVPEITGGMLFLPAEPEVIASFIAEAEAAPEELSAIAMVGAAPPLPFLPEEHHGRLVVIAMMAYAGPPEEGERALAPFRALATPIADMVRPMPYAGLFPPTTEEFRPTGAFRTMFVGSVGRTASEAIVEGLRASTGTMAVTQLRVLGGAMARVPADATAFAHRESRVMVTVAGMYGDPADKPEQEAWVSGLAAELADGDPGVYTGFLGDEGEERVRAAYPGATWDRLAAIKARYDPDNLFRLNHNIPPARAT